MESKTNALLILVIAVVLLSIAIGSKIISDKKRKSMVTSSAERKKNDDNEPHDEPIEPKSKKSFLESTPSVVLALIVMFGVFIVFMGIPEDLVKIDTKTEEALAFAILGGVNAICCFFIVRQNPKSIWYVPLLINLIYIISSFIENKSASDWISVCSIFVLSILASIIGTLFGKRTAISAKS